MPEPFLWGIALAFAPVWIGAALLGLVLIVIGLLWLRGNPDVIAWLAVAGCVIVAIGALGAFGH
jgi:hypothetical protein